MTIQSMKIAPHLFIGLGGCGCQIVNEIARKLKRRSGEYERCRNLVHFYSIDTDLGELKKCDAVDHWIPISNFDKREFVEHAFGQRGAPEDELFTSWWPEYYIPRATSGAGAGQIRIESRLSLYRTLKAMPQYLTAIKNSIRRAYDAGERFRDTDKHPMIHIYTSLAGGTGSGSFLAVAYLLRNLVSDHQSPIVVGTFVLPGVFTGMGLPAQQLDKIMANGYAALSELEYLQGATDSESGKIRLQYDPNSKEPTFVVHGPFNQIYLIDDVGKLASVLSDPREVYPHIADAAYSQIFSDIIERDRSTADNDEREIAISDEQHYTKRYGSFGLSALVLPDVDILEYAGHRYAAEAIERAFALSDEGADDEGADRRGALTPEQRDQYFVRELGTRARLPGETGRFYREAMSWVDGGGEGGTGALTELLRRVDGQLARFDETLNKLPRINEEWLHDFEDDPDAVRVQLSRRLEGWKQVVNTAKADIISEAQVLAKEIAGESHDHSFGKITQGVGMLRVRYLLVRLEAALRERQSAADKALRGTQGSLASWEDKFTKHAEILEGTSPKTFTERFTRNDYFDRCAEFVKWYKDSLYRPQWAALRADADLELFDELLVAIGERRERLAALFGQLSSIRRELLERCIGLLEYGVARDMGGQATEHLLDVEVYQDHLDPAHRRLWNVVYRHRIKPDMFNPEEIARTIQEAERGTQGRRHVREAVIEALVVLGREKLRVAIVGESEPRSLDEMGLELRKGLEEEARISWAWHRLNDRYRRIEDIPDDVWQTAMEEVTNKEVEDYIKDNIALAARKCAPFWRLSEAATKIEPKRYVLVHNEYLLDDWMRRLLTSVPSFHIPEGNMMRSGDAKRIVFYWNEMGVPVYRVSSIGEYGRRYEFVKMDELRRGPLYHRDKLRFETSVETLQRARVACEGKRCPDIPLHTERDWEGAPDPERRLFPITMEAVKNGRAKIAWEKAREQHDDAAAMARRAIDRAEIRSFAICRALGIIAHTGEGYVWTFDELENPEDRVLGTFLDEAREGFHKAREVIKKYAFKHMGERLEEVAQSRDREKIEELLKPHLASLEVALLNAGPREAVILKDEMAELEEQLNKLLEHAS